jgi:putative copper export protein
MVELLIELSQSPLSLAMATSPWIVPTMQSIHIMAIAVVFISVLVTALRVAGISWRGISIRQTVDRFAPWAWTALALLALTGLILIMAEPIRELMAISFWVKMALLVALTIISARFMRTVRSNASLADSEAKGDPQMRLTALLTVAMLVIIIFMGRFIAYDPLIWGPASPIASIYAGS